MREGYEQQKALCSRLATQGASFHGAEEGTRTPTPLRVRGPEPRASANSATSARDTVSAASAETAASLSLANAELYVKYRLVRRVHAGRGNIRGRNAAQSYSGGPTLTTKYDAGSVLLALVTKWSSPAMHRPISPAFRVRVTPAVISVTVPSRTNHISVCL